MAAASASSFEPDRDIGDLSGKVIVVTGGTAGLGRETITNLVKHGSPRVFFTGRNEQSAQATIDAAALANPHSPVTFIKCDLGDLANTKAAAARICAMTERVDVVFCNAGIMATAAGLSADGFETQFATNHLGHAMLVRTLLPALTRTAGARVVFSTSLGYLFAPTIPFAALRTPQRAWLLGAFRRYGQSKLANLLYAAQLAREVPGLVCVAVHPGVVRTGLVTGLSAFNRAFTEATTWAAQVSLAEGVRNQLWAATAPSREVVNGAFYEPVGRLGRMSAAAKDEALAAELYRWTEEVLAQF